MKPKLITRMGVVLMAISVFSITGFSQIVYAQDATVTPPPATTTPAATRTPVARASSTATPVPTRAAPAVTTGQSVRPAAPLSPTGVISDGLISVAGMGQSSVVPDMVVIHLGVKERAITANAALSQTNANMSVLIDKMIDAGVVPANIQTEVVNLFPTYQQPTNTEGTPVLTGYDATNIIRIRTRASEDLGALIDTAVAAGANTIQGIHFESGRPGEALSVARAQAFADARQKAEELATLAGSQLGPIRSIVETNVLSPFTAGEARLAAAAPIQAGTQTVQVVLQITWQLQSATP